MPVQVISTPVKPEPSIVDQISSGFSVFIEQYWAFILIFFGVIVGVVFAIVGVYLFLKWKEGRANIFEKDYKSAIIMAKVQADPKRIQRWSMPTYLIGGLLTGFAGLGLIAGNGLMGFFMTWLIIPTLLGITFFVEFIFKPFRRGDHIFLRFKEDNRTMEREIGQYRGSFYANDGFWYLLVSKGRKWLVFDNVIIIKVPKHPFRNVKKEVIDAKTKEKKIVVKKESLGVVFDDIVQFTDKNIYLNNVASIEIEQFFWYPTFIDKAGKILDNRLMYYDSDRSNALIGMFYDQTNEYAQAQKDAININPRVQYKRATDEEAIDELPKKTDDI